MAMRVLGNFSTNTKLNINGTMFEGVDEGIYVFGKGNTFVKRLIK
jgi:hypothetical protein